MGRMKLENERKQKSTSESMIDQNVEMIKQKVSLNITSLIEQPYYLIQQRDEHMNFGT